MTAVPCAVPSSWGIDTSAKLSGTAPKRLASTPLASGKEIRFVWRYVFFGPARPGDIDAGELEAILEAGLILLLVQHCRSGSWHASGAQGAEDGAWAVRNAQAAGYPLGACIALDLESVANPGAAVQSHATQWCAVVKEAGYLPVVYVGFDCGLTPEELYELPGVERYWSDAGPRSVAERGFCCKQYPQTSVAGTPVDPDQAFPDQLGNFLIGAALEEGDTAPDLADAETPVPA